MKINILKESGYEEAILGLSLSYGVSFQKAEDASRRLYNKDGGHNKFLESIILWVDVTDPRYWWVEADTYRITTKQSESTIHSLGKRPLTQLDFSYPILKSYLDHLNSLIELSQKQKELYPVLKTGLPEGFLQRRIWCLSYKTLRNIIRQRSDHKLLEWRVFCNYFLNNAKRKEYLGDLSKQDNVQNV